MTTEQPGEMNTPEDSRDDGPVDLDDRTDGGAPAANQRQSEHVHPLDSDPSAMTVGAADPQAPSHPDAGERWLHGGGDRSASPEEQDTDVVASAARMHPNPSGLSGVGEPQDVPVASHDAAPGTSETHGVVQGARTPAPPSTAP